MQNIVKDIDNGYIDENKIKSYIDNTKAINKPASNNIHKYDFTDEDYYAIIQLDAIKIPTQTMNDFEHALIESGIF